MELSEWLASYPDRCRHGYHTTQQTCPDCGKDMGIARVEAAADPDLRAMVDEEIRRAAATGLVFSANDFRDQLPDDVGPLMGARFLAACKAGQIVHVGYTQSTKASTHAHDVKTWRAA